MQWKFWERPQSAKMELAPSALMSDSAVSSSPASNTAGGSSYNNRDYPSPSFAERYEVYDTIGRVATAVESVINSVNKRDFYFANVDEEDTDERGIKLMEQWETKFNASLLVENIVRDLLVTGNVIIGPDYVLVNMKAVLYMVRDIYGKPEQVVLSVNGREWPLGAVEDSRGQFMQKIPLDQYIVVKYIDANREAWGRGLFHAITTTFTDLDGKTSTPLYKVFRQIEQDGGKIHHKMSSPRTLWIFPKVKNPDDLNPDKAGSLANKVKHMLAGDRVAMGPEGEGAQIIAEPVDGKARFTEVTDLVKGEVEVTTQSSAARLIEDPSAMADAREANEKDDAVALRVMEIVRRLFDYEIIPRVLNGTGLENTVCFRWGKEDDFEFTFEDIEKVAGMQIGGKPVTSIEEVREMMKKTGIPLDEEKYKTFMQDLEAKRQEQQQQAQEPEPEPGKGPQQPPLPE